LAPLLKWGGGSFSINLSKFNWPRKGKGLGQRVVLGEKKTIKEGHDEKTPVMIMCERSLTASRRESSLSKKKREAPSGGEKKRFLLVKSEK